MKAPVFLCVVVLFVFSSFRSKDDLSPTKSADFWLNGDWVGTGFQLDGTNWQVSLKVQSATQIRIDYPDFPCGGSWTIVSSSGNTIKLKENIKEGADRCDQGDEVTIEKISETRIKVTYFLAGTSSPEIASAFLDKNLV